MRRKEPLQNIGPERKKSDIRDRVVLIGVGLKSEPLQDIKSSLVELEELTEAAGGEVVASVTQVLPQYLPATLIGTGKIEEIRLLVEETQAQLVIMDHQLTGVQGRNLEEALKVRVIDRNQLILDIFAQRAQSYEGKLQVELAQMLDQLPRMVGAWLGSLSRQGGGIGTRGPGETALESDRRRIRERVKTIRKQIEGIKKNRTQHRALRRRQKIPSFALIGYTNSGKSSLLNQLTNSSVLTRDQVFATLDPTTRKVYLPGTGSALVTDTVGFIRKLPTHLVEAFKSTLEESGEADVLIHVIDLSNPQMDKQMKVVENLIEEFGWHTKPLIHVYNKLDIAPAEKQFQVKTFPRVFVSAKTGEGMEKLKRQLIASVQALQEEVELYFPKDQEYRIYDLGRESQISKTEVAQSGTVCYAKLTVAQINRWRDYLVTS